MTYTELIRKLRALGCQFKRHERRGSHDIWHNPQVNRSAVIPHQPGDIPETTLRAILQQLEISPDEIEPA